MSMKRVLVAGCGGLGCYCVEYLARLGICEVRVADGDVFTPGNMNRQLYCTEDTLGRHKAEVAQERWPGIVSACLEFIGEDNAADLVAGCDAVVDALDSVAARRLLARTCAELSVPMVYGAIGDTNCQVCVLYPGDGDVLDLLYPADSAKKIATVSYTPAFCAAMQISAVHRILLNEPVEGRKLYISDLSGMDFEAVEL